VQERKSLLIARLGSFQEFAIGSVGHERHTYPLSFYKTPPSSLM
jgi:hypothetical protein